MDEYVIQTKGLTRCFGSRAVVSDLDLAVPRGCVFGFLGRNGSGKTTTIRMLLGLLPPTRGETRVLGEDSRCLSSETRSRIGYLAEGHPVYEWMRVAECGRFQAACFPTWNDEVFGAVLEHFRLGPDRKVRELSRGERAGLCLALTLAPEPELLILDDPALGLDPVARRSLLEAMIFVTRDSDRTIFFSSHLLGDVERVADWVAVLDRGVLRACCTLATFRRRISRFVLAWDGTPPAEIPPLPGLVHVFRAGRELQLTVANADEDARASIGSIGASRVEEVPIGLEEAFIDYLGDRGEKNLLLSDLEESP
jgi:ABC-2 type transport system ATP-binding protein